MDSGKPVMDGARRLVHGRPLEGLIGYKKRGRER